MLPRRTLLAAPLMTAPLLSHARPAFAQSPAAARKIHIGQASPSLSFLPLQTARALNTFATAGLDLFWVALPGGDAACLAALNSGDIELAAVGSEPLLDAIGKGERFQIVATLMGKVALELVVSNKRIEQSGIVPADDSLERRLSVLKDATIGVSAIGGTQDHAARWLARQAGLTGDIQVTMVGQPPSLQAALDAGHIDAFILAPPEGLLAEDARTGQVLVRMGEEFPLLKNLPSLVLAVKTPVSDETSALIVDTCRALIAASTQLLANPASTADQVSEKLYPHMKPEVVAAAIESLKTGITGRGRIDPAAIHNLVDYAGDAATGFNAAEGGFWTNQFWDTAAK